MQESLRRRQGGRPVLESANNVRKNLLRMYRRQRWRVSHLWLFPVVLVYSELLLRLFCGFNLFKSLGYPLLFGIAAGLFLTCVTIPFKPKVNRIVSMVLLYLIALFFSTEALLHSSFQVFFTPKDIVTGTGGVVGGFLGETLRAIFHGIPKILLLFLPALLYTGTGKRRMPARRYRLSFAAMVLVAALVVQGFTVLIAAHGKSKDQYGSQFNYNIATQTFGLLTSTRLSLGSKSSAGGELVLDNPPADTQAADAQAADGQTVESGAAQVPATAPVATEPPITGDNVMDLNFKETSNETIQNMNAYVQSLQPSNKNKYTGLFKGKNLIIICAEAYCDVVCNEELTPTLYRLVHNGFYFSEFYQPTWGGSTSTGEYSMLFGLAPLNGVDTMQSIVDNNNYFTMGSQLSRLGYHGNAYHDGDYDFYNRNITHTHLGYDEFLALGNGLEDITGWWPGDQIFFDKTMDTYIDNQPFSVYYMSISGHCIYKDDDPKVEKYIDRVKAVFGDRYKQTTMNYFCYQLELEEALKTMVEKLEAKGIADDTVIVMTGDHYPYGLEKSHTFGNFEDYVTDLYGYTYSNSFEQDHNNLIIWSGCLEHENKDLAVEVKGPTYSLDIVPTLSNLFGLEYDSRLLVGRDVFSDTEPLALWTNYSWATDKGKYDSATGEFTPNEGVTVDDAYVDRMKTIVANKLSYSGKVLDEDYFGYLFD